MKSETLFERATADLPGDVREGLLKLLVHLKADLDDPMMVGMAVAGHDMVHVRRRTGDAQDRAVLSGFRYQTRACPILPAWPKPEPPSIWITDRCGPA
jgi:hypothetical protein